MLEEGIRSLETYSLFRAGLAPEHPDEEGFELGGCGGRKALGSEETGLCGSGEGCGEMGEI